MANRVAVGVGIGVGAAAILIIALVVSSMKKLNSDEVGIKYNTIEKTLADSPEYEGLHLGPPGFAFITFPSVFRTMDFSGVKCLNKDGVSITLSVSYQFRVRPQNLKEIMLEFQNYEIYVNILELIGETAVHESCSQFNTSQFQSERGKFQADLGEVIVRKYDVVDCDITDVQVNNIRRPYEYESAIKDKEAAREDIEVALNERPRKLTEATTKKREAETQANITINKANSDARISLTQATSQAAAILNEFEKEAETYKLLVSASGLGLNTEGFLSYLGVRTIANAENQVFVGMKAPARASYVP